MFVVLDLDDTLADLSHRKHYIEKEPKNWEAFCAPDLAIKDKVVAGASRVLTHFAELKYDVIVLTARNEDMRDVTMRWLHENLILPISDDNLLMRPEGNLLNPAEFKREQLSRYKQNLENKDVAFLIIDDDPTSSDSLKDFGVVLKAPECWDMLFPVPPTPQEA